MNGIESCDETNVPYFDDIAAVAFAAEFVASVAVTSVEFVHK